MYKILILIFAFHLVSCQNEIKFDERIVTSMIWKTKSEKIATELIFDISQNKRYGILYNGKLVAENPFIQTSSCELDSNDKRNIQQRVSPEVKLEFLVSQIREKPYRWKQGQIKNKTIIPNKILKSFDRENDTIFWRTIFKEYNDRSFYIVYFPIFSEDFKFALLTTDHYSFWSYDRIHNTSYDGCSTILCKKENDKWVKIDYVNQMVQ